MPKTVTRYDVLISCPSDVGEYIENIKRSIHRFNSTYGDYRDVILRPKYWGDDSFAQSGGHIGQGNGPLWHFPSLISPVNNK